MSVNIKKSFGDKKIPRSTVSQLVMLEVGAAMAEGARKYGRHNYRNKEDILASVYYDSTCRHMDFWWEGEDTDPDSKLSHITKAIASLTVLRDSMLIGTFIDDRPPKMLNLIEWRKELEEKIREMKEKIPISKKAVTQLNRRK